MDWRVVVGGMSYPCKRGGGIVRTGKCPGEHVQGGMSGSRIYRSSDEFENDCISMDCDVRLVI